MEKTKKKWTEKQYEKLEENLGKTTARRHIKSSRILLNKMCREQLLSRIKMVSVL